MNIRLPAVAGRSYPGNPTSLAVAKRHAPWSQPAPDYMVAPAEGLALNLDELSAVEAGP